MVEQLAELFNRIADVGAQHVFTVKLVVHLAHRAFQESHTARVSRAVPGVGTIFGVVQKRLEKRRLNTFEVTFGFADDVARHKLGRVLEHVNETVQFTQDVVGQVAAGLGFAIDVDRHIEVAPAHLFDEVAQVHHRRVQVRPGGEFLVVNRQDEGTGPALLLGELAQVAITGDAQHLETFGLNGLRQRADAQPGSVFGAVVLVNDDNGKAEFHGRLQRRGEK